MKTLFDLQTESGQLWLDIAEHLAAKDAEIAALTAERDTITASLSEHQKLAGEAYAKAADVIQRLYASGADQSLLGELVAVAQDVGTPVVDRERAARIAEADALEAKAAALRALAI